MDPLLFSAVAASLAIAATGFVLILTVRRLQLARAERRLAGAEEKVRALALALVDGQEIEATPLSPEEGQALSRVLARYARRLRGDGRRRIAEFFERSGAVGRELEALSDRRPWRRATAAYTLGDMASATALPALLAALDDREREVRAAAARSLGQLGAVEAVEPLVLALAETRVPRAVAAQALLAIGPEALAKLQSLATHDDAEVRAFAVELLGLLGDASSAPVLVGALTDTSAEVRAKACRALARVGAEEGVEGLRRALADRVPFVRATAATALGAIRDEAAVPALLEQAREDAFFPAAQAAARALAQIDGPLVLAAVSDTKAAHLVEAADVLEIRAA